MQMSLGVCCVKTGRTDSVDVIAGKQRWEKSGQNRNHKVGRLVFLPDATKGVCGYGS